MPKDLLKEDLLSVVREDSYWSEVIRMFTLLKDHLEESFSKAHASSYRWMIFEFTHCQKTFFWKGRFVHYMSSYRSEDIRMLTLLKDLEGGLLQHMIFHSVEGPFEVYIARYILNMLIHTAEKPEDIYPKESLCKVQII